jgi:thiol-disulfide isomerase/thioredoxin
VSKRTRARRRQREAKASKQLDRRPRRQISWKPIAGWGTVAVVGGLLAFALLAGGGGSSSAEGDPGLVALARSAGDGGQVQVYASNVHTVYHSTAPLPSSGEPRDDGRPTLVWFSGTWCTFCERMDPYAFETAEGYAERMVFVEKSVDHDRGAASRYGVRGTPTFVMVDATGGEVARFHFQGNAQDFAAAIEAALERAGA